MTVQPPVKFVSGVKTIRFADAADELIFLRVRGFLIEENLYGTLNVPAILPLLIIDVSFHGCRPNLL